MPAEEPVVRRLCSGGEGIRTFGPPWSKSMSTPPRAADRSGMSVPSPAVTRHRSFAPGGRPLAANSWHANDCGIACGETSTAGTAALQLFLLGFQFFLFGLPLHGAGCPCGLHGLSHLTPRLALGPQLFGLLAVEFIDAPAVHVRIEHLQGSATGVDLIVMGEFGKAFEDAEQIVVPRATQDLHIAGAALRAERPEPRQLVAALRRRLCGKAAERAHQMLRLALAGLPRILAEPDLDALAVLGGGIEQQSLDVARIGPPAHHIQQPVAAIPIAAELDADGPVRVVELGLLGCGEIPIADDIEIGRDRVDHGTPLPLEIKSGRRPDLPIAAQQPLALEQRQ